jgi:hypothetical protein
MGWRFRRSAKLGPFRINLSKSGVGWSLGGRAFRMGKDAKGRTYSQTSIPGTGIYNREYYKNQSAPQSPGSPTQPRLSSGKLTAQHYLWGAAVFFGLLYLLISTLKVLM